MSSKTMTRSRRWSHHSTTMTVGVVSTVGFCCYLALRTKWPLILIWLLSINLTTFLLFAFDKLASKTKAPRAPEVVLHSLTLMGGFVGQRMGRAMFHHKSNCRRHPSFQIVQFVSGLVWGGLLLWHLRSRWRCIQVSRASFISLVRLLLVLFLSPSS